MFAPSLSSCLNAEKQPENQAEYKTGCNQNGKPYHFHVFDRAGQDFALVDDRGEKEKGDDDINNQPDPPFPGSDYSSIQEGHR